MRLSFATRDVSIPKPMNTLTDSSASTRLQWSHQRTAIYMTTHGNTKWSRHLGAGVRFASRLNPLKKQSKHHHSSSLRSQPTNLTVPKSLLMMESNIASRYLKAILAGPNASKLLGKQDCQYPTVACVGSALFKQWANGRHYDEIIPSFFARLRRLSKGIGTTE